MLELLTAPPMNVFTLEEVKLHCRVDSDLTADDEYLLGLLIAAERYVERQTGKQLITASYLFTYSGSPQWGQLRLPRGPLVEVSSVVMNDTVIDPSRYRVVTGDDACVMLTDLDHCPGAKTTDLYTVEFSAGYGFSEEVPETLKVAIRLLVSEWYTRRENSSNFSVTALPIGVDKILSLYTNNFVGVP